MNFPKVIMWASFSMAHKAMKEFYVNNPTEIKEQEVHLFSCLMVTEIAVNIAQAFLYPFFLVSSHGKEERQYIRRISTALFSVIVSFVSGFIIYLIFSNLSVVDVFTVSTTAVDYKLSLLKMFIAAILLSMSEFNVIYAIIQKQYCSTYYLFLLEQLNCQNYFGVLIT
ncbi:Hypothetical_protein [Hexamita inflata]|uniref:Hypothetical_protein n=1 Tax=Hexamita inflata TaxID=28002 RepID=A0ABP1HAX6_9EUKA